MQKLNVFNAHFIPKKAIDIMAKIVEEENVGINAIFLVDALIEDESDLEPFGKFYTEINSIAVNLGVIVAEAVGRAQDDKNGMGYKTVIWLDLLCTMLHEYRHAMQLKHKKPLDDEEADKWAINTLFIAAKYMNIEMPTTMAEWGWVLEHKIKEFDDLLPKYAKEDWAKTQLEINKTGSVEYELKTKTYIPTIKKLAAMHFNDNDPEWEAPYPEDIPKNEPVKQETATFTQTVDTTFQTQSGNTEFTPSHDWEYEQYDESPEPPPITYGEGNFQGQQSINVNTTPEVIKPTDAELQNNPLVQLMMRLFDHVYTKCGWDPMQNPKNGFAAAAQVAEGVFIEDLGLQGQVLFYDGLTPIGTLAKGNNLGNTINGYVNTSGQPCYRITIKDGSSRLIKPVLPDPRKPWGQQAIAGAKRLMILNEGKMSSVVEQAPGKAAAFRTC